MVAVGDSDSSWLFWQRFWGCFSEIPHFWTKIQNISSSKTPTSCSPWVLCSAVLARRVLVYISCSAEFIVSECLLDKGLEGFERNVVFCVVKDDELRHQREGCVETASQLTCLLYTPICICGCAHTHTHLHGYGDGERWFFLFFKDNIGSWLLWKQVCYGNHRASEAKCLRNELRLLAELQETQQRRPHLCVSNQQLIWATDHPELHPQPWPRRTSCLLQKLRKTEKIARQQTPASWIDRAECLHFWQLIMGS